MSVSILCLHIDSMFRNDTQSSMKGEDTITVAARREFHLPVHIEQPGVSLHWEITTDRDIEFKICYAHTEVNIRKKFNNFYRK